MNDDRIAHIEAAISAQGEDWTNQSIYDVVGGNYASLSQYLKARRAQPRRPGRGGGTATAVAEEALASQELATLQEQLEAAQQTVSRAASKAQGLRTKAATDLLSEAELDELARLERRMELTQPVLERLAKEVREEQETCDTEAFRQSWLPLVEQKRQAYEAFVESQRDMWLALLPVEQAHRAQEAAIDSLPPRLAGRLHDIFLPDWATLRKRLCVGMVNAQAWDMLLCAAGQPRLAPASAVMANDPGTKALPPRLLPKFMEGTL